MGFSRKVGFCFTVEKLSYYMKLKLHDQVVQNPATAPILEQIIADMISYIIFIKYILYYPASVTISVYKSLP